MECNYCVHRLAQNVIGRITKEDHLMLVCLAYSTSNMLRDVEDGYG
jgi:hypothetical protein